MNRVPTPGPRSSPDRVPAWYLHSVDAVVLAGPFPSELVAQLACAHFARKLGVSMRRNGGPCTAADIHACVAKLRVGYGVRPEPHGRFQVVSWEDSPG